MKLDYSLLSMFDFVDEILDDGENEKLKEKTVGVARHPRLAQNLINELSR